MSTSADEKEEEKTRKRKLDLEDAKREFYETQAQYKKAKSSYEAAKQRYESFPEGYAELQQEAHKAFLQEIRERIPASKLHPIDRAWLDAHEEKPFCTGDPPKILRCFDEIVNGMGCEVFRVVYEYDGEYIVAEVPVDQSADGEPCMYISTDPDGDTDNATFTIASDALWDIVNDVYGWREEGKEDKWTLAAFYIGYAKYLLDVANSSSSDADSDSEESTANSDSEKATANSDSEKATANSDSEKATAEASPEDSQLNAAE